MRYTLNRWICFGVVAVTLSGCGTQPLNATNEVRIEATPKAAPQRTITNFSNALRCMDDLFDRYNISNVSIAAQDIPDATDQVVAGTKDMLITALSNMSAKSRAIRFVALSYDLEDITRFHQLHPRKNFKSPDFFIRGAVTQVDQGVIEQQARAGVALARAFNFTGSKDEIASIVSLDMNMGLVSTLQMLPAATSSNSIAVIRRGVGTSLTGTIKTLGLLFEVDFARSEGLHHATRTLIELGTIEIIGRLTQVPYWECLDIKETNPLVQKQVQSWFDALSAKDLTTFAQAKLKALGHYDGPLNGVNDAKTREAIAYFKSKQGLVANGEVDYLLYYNLLADETPIDPAYVPQIVQRVNTSGEYARDGNEPPAYEEVTKPTVLEGATVEKSELKLTTSRGSRPVYRSGEALSLEVETGTDAHVYCYYEPTPGEIVKIFPTRFSAQRKSTGGQALLIPSSDQFSIRFDRSGVVEKVLCLSSRDDIERSLPAELRDKALQPVSLQRLSQLYRRPVRTVEDVYRIYKDSSAVVPLKETIKVEVQ